MSLPCREKCDLGGLLIQVVRIMFKYRTFPVYFSIQVLQASEGQEAAEGLVWVAISVDGHRLKYPLLML